MNQDSQQPQTPLNNVTNDKTVPVSQYSSSLSSQSKKKRGGKVALILVSLILVAGAAVGGWWYGTTSAQKESDAKIAELNSKIAALEKKRALAAADDQEATKYVEVKEWGVKVPVVSSGQEISYQIGVVDNNTANFVSSEQKALGGTCGQLSSARYRVLRATDDYKATIEAEPEGVATQLKDSFSTKINGYTYYVIADMSGGVCAGTQKANESVSEQEMAANQNLFNSLKGIVSAN